MGKRKGKKKKGGQKKKPGNNKAGEAGGNALKQTDATTAAGATAATPTTTTPASTPAGASKRDELRGSDTMPPVSTFAEVSELTEDERRKGNKEYHKGNYAEAVVHYTRGIAAAARNPAFLVILFANRAAAHIGVKAYDRCVDDCTAAIALDPESVKAHGRRAYAYYCMQRYADAVHDYEMALKLDPDNTQVKDNLLRASHALAAQDHPSRPGTSDSRSGEEAAAAAAIESGGSADGGGASDSPNVPQSPTRDYGDDGEGGGADLPSFDDLPPLVGVRFDPEAMVRATAARRDALVDSGARLEAVAADGSGPRGAGGWASGKHGGSGAGAAGGSAGGSGRAGGGDGSEADDAALANMTNQERSYHYKYLGNRAFSEGDYEQALQHYTRAIAFNPSEAVFYSNRAAAHLKLERYFDAIHDCNTSLERKPTIKATARRGSAWLALKQYGKAAEDYQRALKFEPRNVECRTELGKCFRLQMEELQRKYADSPDNDGYRVAIEKTTRDMRLYGFDAQASSASNNS